MRVLIIGIDSAIGGLLADTLSAGGAAVYGTTRRTGTSLGDSRLRLDLGVPGAEQTPLPAVDVAVFSAAMARFADCREQPQLARRVNAEVPVAFARRLVSAGSRVILLSTSAVFDGRLPRRRASEPTCPISAYGRLKAEAEVGFLALGAAASVLRLTKVVRGTMPLFAGWAAALAEGRPVRAFSDLRFCPLSMADVIAALAAVIRNDDGGIYQVSGRDDVSYSEAAHHLARRMGASPRLVNAARATDHGVREEEILAHTSLDVERLSALTGFQPPDPWAVLDAVFAATMAPRSRAVA